MGSLRSLRRREVEQVIIPKPSNAELIEAVQSGKIKDVEALVKKGANPNAVNEYSDSVLKMAVDTNKIKLVKLLVDHGANIRYRDDCGYTPLHNAAFAGLKAACEISRFLLDQGANVNATTDGGRTPLMLAVLYKRNVDLVKLLLERGADATVRKSDGKKALDLIGHNKHSEALKALLELVS